jgi:hypothetical protein
MPRRSMDMRIVMNRIRSELTALARGTIAGSPAAPTKEIQNWRNVKNGQKYPCAVHLLQWSEGKGLRASDERRS